MRFEFERKSTASDPLGSEDRRAGAAESVENSASTAGAIFHSVRHEPNRLCGRMRFQVIHPAGTESVGTGIMPDVRPRSAMTAQFNVVQVGRVPHPKHADQLVLASVE